MVVGTKYGVADPEPPTNGPTVTCPQYHDVLRGRCGDCFKCDGKGFKGEAKGAKRTNAKKIE